MPAILDLPEVRALVAPLSVETYEALTEMGVVGKHAELIRGIIVDQMAKSPLHSDLIRQIIAILIAWQRSGFAVFSERPIRLSDSMPEPDLMIARGEVKDFRRHHPTTAALVVEIAVTSVALDREKASIYAEANVNEYWIVLAEQKQIEVYTRPVNGRYLDRRSYTEGETIICGSVPDLTASVDDWLA